MLDIAEITAVFSGIGLWIMVIRYFINGRL